MSGKPAVPDGDDRTAVVGGARKLSPASDGRCDTTTSATVLRVTVGESS
ncbi:hypothetical protein PJI17_19110 [Mycobacterium kansasii]|uniref:Uncharacterized protein n=1 Tax=Mycobacterium kansasii TaxID=1768 RepID=A0A653EUH6_MYCKA|nr:hypothetical protein MKANGN_45760 [Mycobacterium kansasii]VAZ58412.1 hypothetical protein LAUMK22_00200 [Mycobacterium kansasii]VAZ64809.1 hypothetical protein LAUMK40_00930 [Mycobacterium kansasii]VAZ71465.1 hypothetical protein LAUMK7_00819 [Mycobacterium kansasii]VTP01050.1 hypothetical protein BIN_B_02709 [Mycobacterium kansasii]